MKKMQISFYINQFHLWNNSMCLEKICFFFLFYSVHVSLFVYFFFYLTYKTRQNLNFPFHPFSHLFMPNQFFDKKRTGVKTEQLKYLRDLTRTRVTKIPRISWMRHFPVNWFFTVKGNLFSFMARIRIRTVLRGH